MYTIEAYNQSIGNLEKLRNYNDNFKNNKNVESILVYSNVKSTVKPLITFVIPTANRTNTFTEALSSILLQKYKFEIEVIVVDNSADLNRQDIIEALIKIYNPANYCIKYYINQKNIGMTGNFNRCFELSNGEWVAMLHDDDLLAPEYGEEISRCFENPIVNDAVALIKTRYLIFTDKNRIPCYKKSSRGGLKKINKFDSLLKGSGPTAAPTCGMLIRKSSMIDVGGYCDCFYPSMDHILGYQLQRKGYVTLETEDILGYYRIGENASMKKETFLGFAVQDTLFRNYLYEDNFIFRIIGRCFETLNYSLMIEKLLEFAKLGFINELNISDIDFKSAYKKTYVRYFLYRVTRKIENILFREHVYHI